ncbi:methylthioribulose-1-phosphate dehydratase-like [Liolophura sinensis]|uniref:methylthioribulose-1-phosphate dehydratase-like n=1 Tax=Liolophura sinensis TaxID=3198878 RepID=UPI003158F2F1
MSSYHEEHPRHLIPELCRQFYDLGWCTGTGGGVSIKYEGQIYIAPSGVQKERIKGEDLFVQSLKDEDISGPPPQKKLKKSQCTPLFMNAFISRDAGAVIHSHSKHAVMATILNPGREFRIAYQEMIKGIINDKTGINFRYDDTLVIPIVENTPEERDLKEAMLKAMNDYPESPAVLVRRHGFYIWGDSWRRAKTMCECLDYLLDISVQMKSMGLDPTSAPETPKGAYTSTDNSR